jgi:hypothetical protein
MSTSEEQEDVSTQQSTLVSNEEQKKPLTSQERTDRWFQVITAMMQPSIRVKQPKSKAMLMC